MSLFRGFMHDFDDDPFFGTRKKNSLSYTIPADDDDDEDEDDFPARRQTRKERVKKNSNESSSHMMNPMSQMNSMMNSMFSDPFAMLNGFGGMGRQRRSGNTGGRQMMPFGFPNMNEIFQNFQMNMNDPNCHSFSSSTIMTMSSGPDGRPHVYQASQSTRTAPGGIRETKNSVCDSATGTKKLAIGHHIGERSHIKEREQNLHSGQVEEREELINLDEDEAEDFNREWETKTSSLANAIGYDSHRSRGRRPREDVRAILDRYRPHSYIPRSRLSSRRQYPAITSSSSSQALPQPEPESEPEVEPIEEPEQPQQQQKPKQQPSDKPESLPQTSEKGKKRSQEEKNDSSDEESSPKKICKTVKCPKKKKQ